MTRRLTLLSYTSLLQKQAMTVKKAGHQPIHDKTLSEVKQHYVEEKDDTYNSNILKPI